MDKEELKSMLAGGKDCTKINQYKVAYQSKTGKEYKGGCMSCSCSYLYNFLLNFIK